MGRLTDLLNLSNVPRWGICPRIKEQNVGEHVFRVLVIAWELADRLGVTLTSQDLFYALCHDGDETWTGDISGIAKHTIPALADGVAEVKRHCAWMVPPGPNSAIVKCADIIECISWAHVWIPSPRKEYVVKDNVDVLGKHCTAAGIRSDIAAEVLSDIMNDRGRCHTPDWLRIK